MSEALIGNALDLVTIGILTGIFFRLGKIEATLDGHHGRLERLEEET